ncbi:hypothetical protein QQS21_011916 [Conoideocrella luteorostrata]|uniref:Benzoate 4-monooxygenase cytochrome P450 n=1 Tax=Conoideocrella luteorostrata TaxID=1105319 RepID=A0AAJ0FMW9_9HYPO|nr:hypothetical protein QQS21_011916 [Conoideocrella luteorostrata]
MFLVITPIVPYALGLVVLTFLLLPLIRFWQDKNGLRQFPAPSYAAFTSMWRIRHNLQAKHYLAVHHAHKELGTHVRIAPNHVSILDPRAPHDVYGHGANMLKDAWYDAAAGVHRNLADTRVKSEHQAKRKLLSHAFAAKSVTALEPVLVETITSLHTVLRSHATSNEEVNLRMVLNYFTIDLFGRILYSARLDCLERGNDMLAAETKGGTFYKAPFIQSLLDATVLNTAFAFEPSWLPLAKTIFKNHPYKKAGTDWENIVYHNTKTRLANPPESDDLFAKLLQNNKGETLGLSEGEILAECNAMMNAGTETTTAALTNTIFLLFTHPHVLAKLRHELDDAFPTDNIPSYDIASRLPYLRACIEESLRVRPASSFGLPRVVPNGGREIAGKFIPGGVTVSVPTYSLLRQENVFENATEYIPDRWLTQDTEKKRVMMNSHLPFSTGPRACIGRNIAYFEQIVLIASLVKVFDFEVHNDSKLETIERFNSNPGDFPVICKLRS